MCLRVHLTHRLDDELFPRHLCLFLDPLVVVFGQLYQLLHRLQIGFVLNSVRRYFQTTAPVLFVQVQQHLLLKFVLAIVDDYAVIIFVEPVSQSYD